MTAKFEYTDETGKIREAEAFILDDYTKTNTPNSPIMTRADGTLDPKLIPAGAGALPTVFTLEIHQITQQQMAEKRILLSQIPVYNSINFVPSGGLPQRNTVDFAYVENDNSLTWENLGLDGFPEEGDQVEITYQPT